MQHDFIKRCITSLLLVTILSGALAPLKTYADTIHHEYPDNLLFGVNYGTSGHYNTSSGDVWFSIQIPYFGLASKTFNLEPWVSYEFTDDVLDVWGDSATNQSLTYYDMDSGTFSAGGLYPESLLCSSDYTPIFHATVNPGVLNGYDINTRPITEKLGLPEEIYTKLSDYRDIVSNLGTSSGSELSSGNMYYYMLMALGCLEYAQSATPSPDRLFEYMGTALGSSVEVSLGGKSYTDLLDLLQNFGLWHTYTSDCVAPDTKVVHIDTQPTSEDFRYAIVDTVDPDKCYEFQGFSALSEDVPGSDSYMFSPDNLHALGISNDFRNNNDNVLVADYLAKRVIYECLKVYIQTYLTLDTENLNEDVLLLLREFYDSFSAAVPWLDYIYNNIPLSSNLTESIAQLVTDADLDEDAEVADVNIANVDQATISHTEPVTKSTPAEQLFYILTTQDAITSIDRDGILNDVSENWEASSAVSTNIDTQRRDEHVSGKDNFEEDNKITEDDVADDWGAPQGSSDSDEERETIYDRRGDFLNRNKASQSDTLVRLSEYIQTGVVASSYYTPMASHVDDSSVLGFYSDCVVEPIEGVTMSDFHAKYGGLRKALLIDTSGTSVLDYFNGSADSNPSLRICTLKDLIDCGESNVTLYLDTRFYNADLAISQGTRKLQAHKDSMSELDSKLRTLISTYYTINSDTEANAYAMHNFVEKFGQHLGLSNNKTVKFADILDVAKNSIFEAHRINIDGIYETIEKMESFVVTLGAANARSNEVLLDNTLLKTAGYSTYSADAMTLLSQVDNSAYVDLSQEPDGDRTFDNYDSIVLSSYDIDQYLSGDYSFSEKIVMENGTEVQTYATTAELGAMKSFAYVSLLYRSPRYFALDSLVSVQNPVFMASDDMCLVGEVTVNGEQESMMWYRNSLLNWMLLKNLKAGVQIDDTYTQDLDCPVYMDIYGNILTESGTVVIPAATNATLFPGSYSQSVLSYGLLSLYGKEYWVPADLPGAAVVLEELWDVDYNAGHWVPSAIELSYDGETPVAVEVDKKAQSKLCDAFKEFFAPYLIINLDGKGLQAANVDSHCNWMAYVQIINEVMRGTEIPLLDKEKESLYTFDSTELSKLVAATKLEAVVDALHSTVQNTLLAIPNFATMDGFDYYVALAIKFMILLTILSCILMVYRDGAAGDLSLRTFWKVALSSILTFSVIVLVPAVFQLTYYTANKIILEKDAFRVLMVNEEKRAVGSEIGITESTPYSNDGEFKIQLEWVQVPWWKQIENVMFGTSVREVTDAKQEAYNEALIQGNNDVVYENDGVFVTTNALFDSIGIEYKSDPLQDGTTGLYPTKSIPESDMSASYFSPYYVFLNTLLANVNEFNYGRRGDTVAGTNYTEKYVAGNLPKTVGVCYRYFTSKQFMEYDSDIMRLGQMYRAEQEPVLTNDSLTQYITNTDNLQPYTEVQRVEKVDEEGNTYYVNEEVEITDPAKIILHAMEIDPGVSRIVKMVSPNFKTEYKRWDLNVREAQTFTRNILYSTDDIKQFENCLWWNKSAIPDIDRRIEVMDNYAREFVSDNHDLLLRVTDETFIKVFALYMSVKYNQVFGIPSANALEIYNLNTEDLIRLCMVEDKDAALSTTQSFSRFVYTYGGQPTLYVTALLLIFMSLSSFGKPICVIIVFCSVFLSIWVFRVLLQRPSANLLGYVTTICMLCLTNIMHAAVLKLCINLPRTGLSPTICLVVVLVFQILYMCILTWVTMISLKDWYNLGYVEYRKEMQAAKALIKQHSDPSYLDGNAPHYEHGMDYYNALRDRHRRRSALDVGGFDTVNTTPFGDITNDLGY